MANVLVLRHASWNYPVDELSPKGIEEAKRVGRGDPHADKVVVSTYRRTAQTALNLGYPYFVVDSRVNELEYPESFPTPEEYTRFVFEEHLQEAKERSHNFLVMVRGLTEEGNLLVVSHRVIMIALYALIVEKKLTASDWNAIDFGNLEGYEIGFFGEFFGEERSALLTASVLRSIRR